MVLKGVSEGNIQPDDYKLPEGPAKNEVAKTQAQKTVNDAVMALFGDATDVDIQGSKAIPNATKLEAKSLDDVAEIDTDELIMYNPDKGEEFIVEDIMIKKNDGSESHYPRPVLNKSNDTILFDLSKHPLSKTTNFTSIFDIKEQVSGYYLDNKGVFQNYDFLKFSPDKTVDLFRNGQLILRKKEQLYIKESHAKLIDKMAFKSDSIPENLRSLLQKNELKINIVPDQEWNKAIHHFENYITNLSKKNESIETNANDINSQVVGSKSKYVGKSNPVQKNKKINPKEIDHIAKKHILNTMKADLEKTIERNEEFKKENIKHELIRNTRMQRENVENLKVDNSRLEKNNADFENRDKKIKNENIANQ